MDDALCAGAWLESPCDSGSALCMLVRMGVGVRMRGCGLGAQVGFTCSDVLGLGSSADGFASCGSGREKASKSA